MSKARASELLDEALNDLCEAESQGNVTWIALLKLRVANRKAILSYFERKKTCDICGNVGCHCRGLMYGFTADEPLTVEAT